jgi:hypothetical protein
MSTSITYDDLFAIKDTMPAYDWQTLLYFHLYYGYISGFDGRKLKYLKKLNLIEWNKKQKKYQLTTKGALIIARRLGTG